MKAGRVIGLGSTFILIGGLVLLGISDTTEQGVIRPPFNSNKTETVVKSTEEEIPEEPEVVYAFPAAKKAAEKGLPTPPDIDINSWEYVLVNSVSTIDGTFIPDTDYAYCYSSGSEQDYRICEALSEFASATENQGLDVYLSSGYRSYETQSYLFELKCQEYDRETAATIVAIPGTSEHQTGLCCDITDYPRDYMNSELEDTDTYKWMSTHCAEYGFIVRYPKDKEDVTQIIYEPWHYRYVGKEAAKYIMDNGLCLEEFVELYKDSAPAASQNTEEAEDTSESTEAIEN